MTSTRCGLRDFDSLRTAGLRFAADCGTSTRCGLRDFDPLRTAGLRPAADCGTSTRCGLRNERWAMSVECGMQKWRDLILRRALCRFVARPRPSRLLPQSAANRSPAVRSDSKFRNPQRLEVPQSAAGRSSLLLTSAVAQSQPRKRKASLCSRPSHPRPSSAPATPPALPRIPRIISPAASCSALAPIAS
jgi:hypothetical protein